MSTRTLQRNTNTMHLMLGAYTNEGKAPALTAITTLYTSLLNSNAGAPTWELFNKVASLPLVTNKLMRQCQVTGYYTWGGRWVEGACEGAPHCGHRNVQVSCTVQLAPLDHHQLATGLLQHGRGHMAWWGKQLAKALGA